MARWHDQPSILPATGVPTCTALLSHVRQTSTQGRRTPFGRGVALAPGRHVVQAVLLEGGARKLAVLTHPSSASRPAIHDMRSRDNVVRSGASRACRLEPEGLMKRARRPRAPPWRPPPRQAMRRSDRPTTIPAGPARFDGHVF